MLAYALGVEIDVGLVSIRPIAGQFGLGGIHLNLEQRQGRTNYGVILDHMGGAKSSGDNVDEQDVTNVVLEEVVIRDVAAHVQLLLIAGKLSAIDIEVPDIRLRNVGSGGEGVPQILAVLTRAVLKSVEAVATKALESIEGLIPRKD